MRTRTHPKASTAVLFAALAAGLSTVSAVAVSIPITNHGFEADLTAVNTFRPVIPQGWQVYDPSFIVDQGADAVGVLRPTSISFFPGGTTEGVNAALVYLAGDVGAGPVGLAQTVNAALQPHTRYTLRADVGNIASGTSVPPNPVQYFNLDGFPGYRVQLLAGGVVIAQDDNTLAGSIPEGEFRTSTVTLDVGASHAQIGQPLGVRVVNLNAAGTPEAPGIEVDFDNIRLDADALAPVCVGDINADGAVGTADLTALLAVFGQAAAVGSPAAAADFNADGAVNTADLAVLLARFGQACPA